MFKTRIVLFLLAATLIVSACGGADRTKAQVRLVNASAGYAQLDMRVEDTVRQGGVAYGQTAGYVEVDPDESETTLTNAGSPTPLLTFTPSVSKDDYYTVLAFGDAGALRHLVLDDNSGEPADNRGLLRVVNAAPGAGPLDVYLTASGDALENSVPTQAGAAYGVQGGWITIISNTWRLRVTAAGSKTDVRLDLPAVGFGSRSINTLVIAPTDGGVLVRGLLMAQQGSINRAEAQQARVRLASMMAGSATVGATLGGQNLATSQLSPAVPNYSLVASGTLALSVGVNGGAQVAQAPRTLDPGRDYTLVVHGPVGQPQVSWLVDDNRPASDTSRAKLRLVNVLAENSAALSMTLDVIPVADNVGIGAGSAYAAVSPTTGTGSGSLLVATAGSPTPVFTVASQQFLAGSVYSVFVSDTQASAKGSVIRDR
jgi:Domain of unknown function (DUF4397)